MESIKEFEIHVDITDREVLYDYVSCKVVKKPPRGWELRQLKQYGQVESYFTEDDENAMVRVDLMDKAIEDIELHEKKDKEDPADSSDEDDSPIVFDRKGTSEGPPRRLLPIYLPGEVVKGNVVLNISETLPAKKLSLRFDGQAVVNIRVYHRYGYYDYTKEEKFNEAEVLLWKKSEDKNIDELSEKLLLLSATPGSACSKAIPPGIHRFPFEFHIPANVPQSCPPIIPRSADFAHLIYRLKSTIDKDKIWGCGNITTHQGVWIETDYDIGNEPDAMQPVTIEETLDTGVVQFWKSGRLSVKVTLPQSAFLKGQHIPMYLEIDNQTKGEIKKAKARIRMYGKARQGEGKLNLSHAIDVKAESVSEGPIAVGMCPSYQWTLPWDFSDCSVDGNLLPVGDLNTSVLLDINYEIFIEIKRKGLHRNMEIHVPIKVGNVNSQQAACSSNAVDFSDTTNTK